MSSAVDPHAAPPASLIVVGASAGGIEALRSVVAHLPGDLAAPVLVVVHSAPDSPRVLPDILRASGVLPAEYARHGDVPRPARIYLAPPDHHLILGPEGLEVVCGPKENRARPAIDPLFRSAAAAYGPRVIGVVLSGMLDDGTAGLSAIKHCGGRSVVQDPADARYGEMPRNALTRVPIDHCLPADRIGELLGKLARDAVATRADAPAIFEQARVAADMARMRRSDMH